MNIKEIVENFNFGSNRENFNRKFFSTLNQKAGDLNSDPVDDRNKI